MRTLGRLESLPNSPATVPRCASAAFSRAAAAAGSTPGSSRISTGPKGVVLPELTNLNQSTTCPVSARASPPVLLKAPAGSVTRPDTLNDTFRMPAVRLFPTTWSTPVSLSVTVSPTVAPARFATPCGRAIWPRTGQLPRASCCGSRRGSGIRLPIEV